MHPVDTPLSARHPEPSYGPVPNDQRPRRLLLAEDDDEVRIALAQLLTLSGYEVITVANGAELLDLLADSILRPERPVDLDAIVTDVRMPGCSGLTVVEGLRNSGWTQPMVVISAFGDDELHARVGALPNTRMLDKPFDPARLMSVLDGMLDEQD